MENTNKKSKWSGVLKKETSFDVTEWPTLDEKTEVDVKKEEPVFMDQEMSMQIGDKTGATEFPSLIISQRNLDCKKRRKAYQLSQESSNDKPFNAKYSRKVRKRITKSSRLCTFLSKKPVKVVKDVDLEIFMQKIKDSQIITFKGRKREFPKRKITRLKKNILRIRAERAGKQEAVDTTETEIITDDSVPLKPDVIELIGSLKLEDEIVQHSRQFRSYCTNLTSHLLCELTENLLVQLRTFQQKQHQRNPENYKKRYITGMNETRKFLEVKKVKLLIIAPDLEPNPGVGGLDETVGQMKAICEENHVPYLFSLKRRKIGYVLFKKVPVSCVGILNIESCEEIYGRLMNELVDQVARYKSATIIS